MTDNDNTGEVQTCNDQDQEEFSSVIIPIFADLTNACQESQVASSFSCSLPTEDETPLQSVPIRQRIPSLLKISREFHQISELDSQI